MKFRWLAGACAALLIGNAAAQSPDKGALGQAPVWDRLERFRGEREFLDYLRAVRRAARAHGYDWAAGGGVQYAQSEEPALCSDGTPPPCKSEEYEDNIVVTGSRLPAVRAAVATSPTVTQITNVQTMGVDEGDIVKQIGQFLIVLQDGRLFVIDTRPDGAPGLRLTSRVDVYRDASSDSWYDEMLVTPERIVVTGYSYDQAASEISVFSFDRAGVAAREAVYYISSNDYYDIENYATRLVNGRLVIYTPLDLVGVNPDRPLEWPLVRRWLRDGEDEPEISAGVRLFDAQDIYKPITRTFQPSIHSISVCELGASGPGDELDCATQAFVGGGARQFFVSTTDAYLWVTPGWAERTQNYNSECIDAPAGPDAFAVPATVFRAPLSGRAPSALFARGEPLDQFGLAVADGEFRALLAWNTEYCADDDAGAELRYLHAPLAAFRAEPRAALARNYAHPPAPGAERVETRFTDAYVVYGARQGYSSHPPGESEPPLASRVVALPLARPDQWTMLEAPHDAMRIERVGDNIAVTGYRDEGGLSLSIIDLRATPRVADTLVLEGRFESEGRSHAFNSLVDQSGVGLMGIPTVRRENQSGRWWWRSQSSNVSFLSLDAGGRLGDLGSLDASEKPVHPDYECEVSCIDWYGNSRPIFTDGRVFALSGTELIEGAVAGGRIAETRRLNLSAPASGGHSGLRNRITN